MSAEGQMIPTGEKALEWNPLDENTKWTSIAGDTIEGGTPGQSSYVTESTPVQELASRVSILEEAVRELQEATALTHEGNVTVAGLGDDAIAGAKEA